MIESLVASPATGFAIPTNWPAALSRVLKARPTLRSFRDIYCSRSGRTARGHCRGGTVPLRPPRRRRPAGLASARRGVDAAWTSQPSGPPWCRPCLRGHAVNYCRPTWSAGGRRARRRRSAADPSHRPGTLDPARVAHRPNNANRHLLMVGRIAKQRLRVGRVPIPLHPRQSAR